MNPLRLLGVLVVLLSFILPSCQSPSVSPSPQVRYRLVQHASIDSVIQTPGVYAEEIVSHINYDFKYDSSGKLASYTLNSYGRVSTTTFTYNGKGQLTRQDTKPADSMSASNAYTVYEYNQADKLITVTTYNAVRNKPTYYISWMSKFEYDNELPDPIKEVRSYYTNNVVTFVYNFTYSYKNGNLFHDEYSIPTNSSSGVILVSETYTFDDKPNPFYRLMGVPGGLDGARIYSRNNITSGKQSIMYDVNGLLTKAVVDVYVLPHHRVTYLYSYEQY